MEYLNFSYKEGQLHIEGFPDAIKLIKVNGHLARQASDLNLHLSDLNQAEDYLLAINQNIDNQLVRSALWCASIVYYFKCFGSSKSRTQLSANKVYKGEPDVALEVFEYLKNLRNKHYVHDENSFSQSLLGAAINDGKKQYKVEKVICMGAHMDNLNEASYSNMSLLISKAKEWVISEFDKICDLIKDELEKIPHSELLNRECVQYLPPNWMDVEKNRKV